MDLVSKAEVAPIAEAMVTLALLVLPRGSWRGSFAPRMPPRRLIGGGKRS